MTTAKKASAKKKAPAKKKTAAKKAPAKNKTTAAKAKRVAKRQERREKIRRLGRLIQAGLQEAAKELPKGGVEQRRDYVVSILNQKLDLPILNDEQEEVVLRLLVDAVADITVSTDNRGNLQKGALAAFQRLRNLNNG